MAAKTRHKKSEVKIQHCPISSKFDMWVDNDVPNLLVYSIKQQIVFMCFLLPVDGKPTADKMSVNKSKATFEIEQC
jgi:hypothetical protein